MNFHSPKKSKIGSGEPQTKSPRKKSTNTEHALSGCVRRHPEKLSVDSLNKFIWSTFGETLKLENFPFVVLFALAAASLISRVWLIWH
jgi:hypothetical protein